MSQADRVVTVTINPAIDQTVDIPNFRAGAVNQVRSSQLDAGGKGINVASFLADYGQPVTVTGFLGAGNDEIFRRFFARKGIDDRFVRITGQTRTGVKIIDEALRQTTDINFPGETPGPADIERLFDILRELSAAHEWFVLSGSIPAGVSAGIYREMVKTLRRRDRLRPVRPGIIGVYCLLDRRSSWHRARPDRRDVGDDRGSRFPGWDHLRLPGRLPDPVLERTDQATSKPGRVETGADPAVPCHADRRLADDLRGRPAGERGADGPDELADGMQATDAVVLGIILGAMMAFDMGGPVNKAAYVLGISFITEGAIPFAARDPFRVIPSLMVGSAVTGALSMAFRVELLVPHGRIFVLPIPNAVTNLGMYVVAIAVGTMVTTGMLFLLKRPLAEAGIEFAQEAVAV